MERKQMQKLDRKIPYLALAPLALILGTSLSAQDLNKKVWTAPSRAKRKVNPLSLDQESILAGKAIFLRNCMVCHGTQGKGDGPAAAALKPHPKDLTDPAILEQKDGELYWKIRTGKAPMPGFATSMKRKEIWQVINFLRNLEMKRAKLTVQKVKDPKSATHRIFVQYTNLLKTLKSKQWAPSARKAAKAFAREVASLQIPSLRDKAAKDLWLSAKKELQNGAIMLMSPKEKDSMEGFQQITKALDKLLTRFGNTEKSEISLFVCKMGKSKGGNLWLQLGKNLQNPFPWGVKMPTCGERVKTYELPQSAKTSKPTK